MLMKQQQKQAAVTNRMLRDRKNYDYEELEMMVRHMQQPKQEDCFD
jgi:hypothetical protein